MRSPRTPTLVAVGWVLALTGTGVAVTLALRDQLPARVVIHWGVDGPDGYAGPTSTLVLAAVLTTLVPLALLAVIRAVDRTGSSTHIAAGLAAGTATFLAVVTFGATLLQVDGGRPRIGWLIVAAAAAGLAVGVLLGRWAWPEPLPPEQPLPPPGADAPRASLRGGSTAAWVTSIRPGAGVIAGLAVVALGAAGLVNLASASLALSLVPVVLIGGSLVMLWARASVDRRGLRVRSLGVIPWVSVPLEHIRAARVVEIDPWGGYGGWGYRIGRDGSRGFVTRSGPALRLDCAGRPDVVLSTTDAEQAAALVNALLDRARA